MRKSPHKPEAEQTPLQKLKTAKWHWPQVVVPTYPPRSSKTCSHHQQKALKMGGHSSKNDCRCNPTHSCDNVPTTALLNRKATEAGPEAVSAVEAPAVGNDVPSAGQPEASEGVEASAPATIPPIHIQSPSGEMPDEVSGTTLPPKVSDANVANLDEPTKDKVQKAADEAPAAGTDTLAVISQAGDLPPKVVPVKVKKSRRAINRARNLVAQEPVLAILFGRQLAKPLKQALAQLSAPDNAPIDAVKDVKPAMP